MSTAPSKEGVESIWHGSSESPVNLRFAAGHNVNIVLLHKFFICRIFLPFALPDTKSWRLEKFLNIIRIVLWGFNVSNWPYFSTTRSLVTNNCTPRWAASSALARSSDIGVLSASAHVRVKLVWVWCKCSMRLPTVGEILSRNCSAACSKWQGVSVTLGCCWERSKHSRCLARHCYWSGWDACSGCAVAWLLGLKNAAK